MKTVSALESLSRKEKSIRKFIAVHFRSTNLLTHSDSSALTKTYSL